MLRKVIKPHYEATVILQVSVTELNYHQLYAFGWPVNQQQYILIINRPLKLFSIYFFCHLKKCT